MTQAARLTGLGMQTQLALNVTGGVANTQTALGTNQATAGTPASDNVVFTSVPSGTGVRLFGGTNSQPPISPGDTFNIVNYDAANALLIYPPVGGKLNNGTTNASVSLAITKSAMCTSIDGLNYSVAIGA